MNLKSLKVFAYVMEEGTLAKASARMHLSQSAASRLLTLLEEEFQVQLFHRDKKRLIPTPQGDQFYPEALRILSQIDEIPTLIKQIQTDTVSPMQIVCHARVVNGLVLPAMTELARSRPDLQMKLEIYPRRDLGRRIMNDLFDIGVSTLPLPVEKLQPYHLARTNLHVAVARDHSLARLEVLRPKDIAEHNYIALDQGTVIRRIVDQELAQLGLSLKIAHEVSVGAAAYRLVRAGLGFAFADPIALDPELSTDIALIPWHPETRVEFGYFVPKSGRHHAAVTEFGAIMSRICAQRLDQ